ncbi:unnamed protein product [Lactuca saligna]|uniref:Uncharacterized protein n=1 Tax=Lactuca saligna TaxID=75948 RepID=A0AA36EL53_LACSI|nr:unnamed protein product [Lactuca saligna]
MAFRVLLPQTNEKKSNKSKKTDAASSGTKVKSTSSSKSTKQVLLIEAEPIQSDPIIADTQLTEKEVIPLKAGVFRRIKMKSKSKRKGRSALTNIVRKAQVSHQGKKNGRVILSSESTADEGETIPETPEADLINDSSQLDTSVSTPPEVSIAKTVTVDA